MVRAPACTAEMRRGRMLKAVEFLDAASLIAGQAGGEAANPDAITTLYIHAGIAAADVICCARLGQHAQGQDHNEAVRLLHQADSGSARHLRVLLGMKTKAGYSHARSTAADAKRAGRVAEALVESARRVSMT
ncbi:MAG TPA: hypothetical protein VH637_22470 [Streptosporangiaceae bacterium]|jgi:hypothetical protein